MWQGPFDLDNRNVVITGGATGIGFAIGKNLGKRGCRIMIAEPDEARLQSAVEALRGEGIDATYQICDVTSLDQVEQLAERAWNEFERVDMIFNNAGIGIGQKPIIDTPMAELHAVFDVNFFGVWHVARVFAARLVAQGSPAGIYNTGSENSLFNAVPNNAAYLATKHAVLGMTDNLREQMPDFIHVGLIIPGFVKSGLTEAVAHLAMDTDEFAAIVLRQIGDGQFYIVSHACNTPPIDERYAEITKAYETYAPRYEGDEKYDVRYLISQMGN
jgi:NAD(P)-dependent dehydrogenase (short-subunit alcohol dehydrogenase family)